MAGEEHLDPERRPPTRRLGKVAALAAIVVAIIIVTIFVGFNTNHALQMEREGPVPDNGARAAGPEGEAAPR